MTEGRDTLLSVDISTGTRGGSNVGVVGQRVVIRCFLLIFSCKTRGTIGGCHVGVAGQEGRDTWLSVIIPL